MRGTVRRAVQRRLHTFRSTTAESTRDPSGFHASAEGAPASRLGRAARIVAIVLAILTVPAVGLAIDVRGTLTVPSDFAPPAPEAEPQRSRYWEEWNGVLEARAPRFEPARELAVVLTGPGEPSTGEQPAYRVHNGSLAPSTIVARAGTAIQLRNDDGVPYELYAEGNDEMGPIQTAPGNSRPITIAAPGEWTVRDRTQPHVRGHLHALPDLVARAFVEPSGAYTFRGVAPGTYRLRVFHGPREVIAQDVIVPESGQLTVPPIQLTPAAAAAQP